MGTIDMKALVYSSLVATSVGEDLPLTSARLLSFRFQPRCFHTRDGFQNFRSIGSFKNKEIIPCHVATW